MLNESTSRWVNVSRPHGRWAVFPGPTEGVFLLSCAGWWNSLSDVTAALFVFLHKILPTVVWLPLRCYHVSELLSSRQTLTPVVASFCIKALWRFPNTVTSKVCNYHPVLYFGEGNHATCQSSGKWLTPLIKSALLACEKQGVTALE